MKIGIANGPSWTAGGVEVYLGALIPELQRLGHEVLVGYESTSRKPAYWPRSVASYDLSKPGKEGRDGYLNKIDLHYVHGLKLLESWDALLADAPCVYFAHDYQATCISGSKRHRLLGAGPCCRKMGAACLLHFYPRRCGGLNPVTLLRDYRQKSSVLERIRACRVVLTHSLQMEQELKRNLPEASIRRIPFCLPDLPGTHLVRKQDDRDVILFLGRFEADKGADLLIRAVAGLPAAGHNPVLVLAGEGRQKPRLTEMASDIRAHGVDVEFPGWIDGDPKEAAFARASVFAMPSLWPEPLGMAPLEALCRGVPVAGFPGGYAEHVTNGFNGRIATERSAAALTMALDECLRDPAYRTHAQEQAPVLRDQLSTKAHAGQLASLLELVAKPWQDGGRT